MEHNWTDKYLIGIDDIDEQHRVFFELWDITYKKSGFEKPEQLSKIIKQLEDYINYHFEYEEKLLEKEGYDRIEEHKSEHRFFIQKVGEMRLELEYMNPQLFEKIAFFMKKWFLSHIMQSDRDYVETVKKSH